MYKFRRRGSCINFYLFPKRGHSLLETFRFARMDHDSCCRGNMAHESEMLEAFSCRTNARMMFIFLLFWYFVVANLNVVWNLAWRLINKLIIIIEDFLFLLFFQKYVSELSVVRDCVGTCVEKGEFHRFKYRSYTSMLKNYSMPSWTY